MQGSSGRPSFVSALRVQGTHAMHAARSSPLRKLSAPPLPSRPKKTPASSLVVNASYAEAGGVQLLHPAALIHGEPPGALGPHEVILQVGACSVQVQRAWGQQRDVHRWTQTKGGVGGPQRRAVSRPSGGAHRANAPQAPRQLKQQTHTARTDCTHHGRARGAGRPLVARGVRARSTPRSGGSWSWCGSGGSQSCPGTPAGMCVRACLCM